MKWKEFFEENKDVGIKKNRYSLGWGTYEERIPIEELYQAFKERMLDEMKEKKEEGTDYICDHYSPAFCGNCDHGKKHKKGKSFFYKKEFCTKLYCCQFRGINVRCIPYEEKQNE